MKFEELKILLKKLFKQYVKKHAIGYKTRSQNKVDNVIVSNESLYTHANLDKSKSVLGYNPKISFKEGIKEFLDWHKTYEQ